MNSGLFKMLPTSCSFTNHLYLIYIYIWLCCLVCLLQIGWVLWQIKPCRIFKTKSYIYITLTQPICSKHTRQHNHHYSGLQLISLSPDCFLWIYGTLAFEKEPHLIHVPAIIWRSLENDTLAYWFWFIIGIKKNELFHLDFILSSKICQTPELFCSSVWCYYTHTHTHIYIHTYMSTQICWYPTYICNVTALAPTHVNFLLTISTSWPVIN